NPRVCVEIDEYLGLKTADTPCKYSNRFRSLIAFGTARIVQPVEEKRRALQLLMEKYAGRSFDFDEQAIGTVEIIEIPLEEVTGKQSV
ncbi:MAG: pyridoxamine 5'-phosphate oxidase family protein, partial [Spirochaetales bacterium]|nr:pyridoxamine 5'-phosphate oxidase family protein [Spirochaetales bacterium]